ncbi:hypothetical protein [uncultured Roseobacter sp.]|uniref:hypothetical protein n=1 Tax=uncultured Roseobacter sp. TaxID=114847 RepID=UPI00261B12FF|nr:hypothetical protein [uncultured Roseobacter sp.]
MNASNLLLVALMRPLAVLFVPCEKVNLEQAGVLSGKGIQFRRINAVEAERLAAAHPESARISHLDVLSARCRS